MKSFVTPGVSMGGVGVGSFAFVGTQAKASGQPGVFLSIELGEFCPLHCKHCIYESTFSFSEGRPRDDVLSAIEGSLPTISPAWLSFSGKEPTAYPDELKRMLRVVKDKATTPTVVMTNGLKRVDALADADLVDISLDGDRAAHECCRGSGTFERTMTTVRQLAQVGKRVGIIATAYRGTLPDGRTQVEAIGALARLLKQEFGESGNVSLSVSLYYGKPGDPMLLTEEDLKHLLSEVCSSGMSTRILWTSLYGPHAHVLLKEVPGELRTDAATAIPYLQDGTVLHLLFNAGQTPLVVLRVGHAGDVFVGCNHLTWQKENRVRFPVGNVLTASLGEILDKVALGKTWLDLSPDARCFGCERFGLCRGGDTLSGQYAGQKGDPYCSLLTA
jgi:pyruvate-formate lyase-activating enzyme